VGAVAEENQAVRRASGGAREEGGALEERNGGAGGVEGRQIPEEQSMLEVGDHAQQRRGPGKEVGDSESMGARRTLAGSVGPIGGRRGCERHRSTPRLAGNTAMFARRSGGWTCASQGAKGMKIV
jgi:hypothetical protein